MHRLVAGILAGLLVAGSVLAGAGAASAKDFGDILDLFNYKLLKSGTELQAAMGPAAQSAWGAETARLATRSASAYNIAAATSGIAEVVPDAVYLRPQDLPTIKPTGGFKHKVTKFTGVGLNKPQGAGAAAIALVGFQFRADLADGISSLFGFDANGLVCGDPVAGSGFVNWITGQDCSEWQMTQDAIAAANADAAEGWVVPGACYASACFQQVAEVVVQDRPTSCLLGDSGLSGGSPVAYLIGQFPDGSWHRGDTRGWDQSHYSPARSACAAALGGGPDSSTFNGELFFWTGAGGGYAALREVSAYGLCGYSLGLTACVDGGVDAVSPEYNDGNPPRYFVCDYTGDDGNHYTANSEQFHEGDGVTPPVVCPELPAGVEPVNMKIMLMGGPEPLTLSDEDALPDPLGDGSETNGVTTAYCQTHVCVLELMDLRTGKSCFDEGDACDGWLTSPTRDTDYKCYYGGEPQDFKQCYVYAQVFNTAKRLDGHPYADPKTGDDVDVVSGLSIDELTMANEPRPAALGRNCFGGDWGASNPVNWVLRPIQCALEWAFVARPQVVNAQAGFIEDAWAETAPGEVITAVAGWGFPSTAGGCAGPELDVPYLGLSGHPLSACAGTFLAPMASAVRTFTTLILILGGGFVIVRLVAGVIGYKGVDGQ